MDTDALRFTRVRELGPRRGVLAARCDLVRLDDGRMAVLKDFSGLRDPVRRAIGRIAAARERRAYAGLEGTPGIPRLLAGVGRAAVLVEYIAGAALTERPALADPGRFVQRLEQLLNGMHARGIAHGEVRMAHVLVDAAQDPWLIDFATATVSDPSQPALLYRVQRRLDRYGWLLIKDRLLPNSLTPAEQEERRRTRWLAAVLRHNVI